MRVSISSVDEFLEHLHDEGVHRGGRGDGSRVFRDALYFRVEDPQVSESSPEHDVWLLVSAIVMTADGDYLLEGSVLYGRDHASRGAVAELERDKAVAALREFADERGLRLGTGKLELS